MGTNPIIEQKGDWPSSLKSVMRNVFQRRETVLIILIIVMMIFISSISPAFLSYKNFIALISNEAIKEFVLIGVLLLLITRDFDLSIGSGVALVGIVMAQIINQNGNLALALIGGIFTGIAIGFINGVLVTKLRLASFIATLGVMYMARSLCNVVSFGTGVPVENQAIITFMNSYLLGFPVAFIAVVIFGIIMAILLDRSKQLRRLYYTGVNEKGAKMVGINTGQLRFYMFVFSGLMMAVTGIAYTGMLRSAVPTAFTGLEMKLIAMAVIGGCSLKGGQGTVFGVTLGLILVTLIGNAMTIIGISPIWEGTILGTILIIAAIFDVIIQKRVE